MAFTLRLPHPFHEQQTLQMDVSVPLTIQLRKLKFSCLGSDRSSAKQTTESPTLIQQHSRPKAKVCPTHDCDPGDLPQVTPGLSHPLCVRGSRAVPPELPAPPGELSHENHAGALPAHAPRHQTSENISQNRPCGTFLAAKRLPSCLPSWALPASSGRG